MFEHSKWKSPRPEKSEPRVLDFCARNKSKNTNKSKLKNPPILRESEGIITAKKASLVRNPFVSNRSSFNEIFTGTFTHKRRSRVVIYFA